MFHIKSAELYMTKFGNSKKYNVFNRSSHAYKRQHLFAVNIFKM